VEVRNGWQNISFSFVDTHLCDQNGRAECSDEIHVQLTSRNPISLLHPFSIRSKGRMRREMQSVAQRVPNGNCVSAKPERVSTYESNRCPSPAAIVPSMCQSAICRPLPLHQTPPSTFSSPFASHDRAARIQIPYAMPSFPSLLDPDQHRILLWSCH
jgi:hypothetical protein